MKRAIVRGPLAGLVGTAVMTLAQRWEMSVTGRRPSTVPRQVAERLLGRTQPATVAILNLPTHWAHGADGPPARCAGRDGLRGVTGSAVFFVLMWTGDAILYRALGIADWPWRWTPAELATDVGHKVVYALATGATYDILAARDSAHSYR